MWDFFPSFLCYYWIFRNKTWQISKNNYSTFFTEQSLSSHRNIFDTSYIVSNFFFSSFYVESNFMKNGQSTVCRLARRKSSRKIFPATPWRTVLLGRFHNFPRNRVRFKGTTHPTMKLLALSAEIPSLENLYIYSSFCTLWMKLRYNFCRYPLSKSVYDKSPSRFSTSFQAFESS